MSYAVSINYGSGWVDITSKVLQESFEKTESLLNDDRKPVVGTASFQVAMDTTFAHTLITLPTTTKILCVISKSGSAWFTGYLRPVTEFVVDNSAKVIRFEVVDYLSALQKEVASTLSYGPSSNMVVCRASGGATSLLHAILSAAGYPGSIAGEDILDPVQYYREEAGKGTYLDLVSELLFSYHRTCYADVDGTLRLHNWGPSSVSTSGTFNSSNIIERLQVERKDNDEDCVETNWYKIVTENRQVVGGDGGYGDVSVPDTGYYPPKYTDDYVEKYWNWSLGESSDREVLGITPTSWRYFVKYRMEFLPASWSWWSFPYNQWLSGDFVYKGNTYFSVIELTHETNKARTIFYGMHTFWKAAVISAFEVYADVTYRVKQASVRYPTGGTNPKTIDGKYLYSLDAANRLLAAYNNAATTGAYRYRFKSLTKAEIGSYWTLENINLNISTIIRITRRSTSIFGSTEIYEYEAEGASAIGTIVAEVLGGTYAITPTTASLVAGIIAANNGLSPSGHVIQAIEGALLGSLSPAASGLYFSNDYLGFYRYDDDAETGEWTAYLKNDGTFRFEGDSNNFISWNGASLLIQGTAKSANYSEGSSGWRIAVDGNAEFNNVTVRGTIYSSLGQIGGFTIGESILKSAASGPRIELDQGKNRVTIFDATEAKLAMGYLDGLLKFDGSGYWGPSDYGFWARQGNRLQFDGNAEYYNGSWAIKNDASYVILDASDNVIARLGTYSGHKGLYLFEENTGANYRAKIADDGVYIGTDDNFISFNAGTGALSLKLSSIYLSSLATRVLGTVEVSNAGDLVSGLTDPIKVYVEGSSTRVGVIEQANQIKFVVGSNAPLKYEGSLLNLYANSTEAVAIQVGVGRTGSGYAYIDLIGDATYTDYGLRIIRANGGANTSSFIQHRGTGTFVIEAIDAGVITFSTNSAERMRIDSSGNVAIGTSDPAGHRLRINGGSALITGSRWASTGDASPLYLGDSNHGIKSLYGQGVMIFTYNVTNGIFLQQSTGDVSIGTSDPAGYKLRVNGDVLIDGKLRGRTLWVLTADTSSISAAVQSEDGSYNVLYAYNGTIYGAYVWNALSAILSNMGKSTSTGRIVCSGQMNSLALAFIYHFSNTIRIYGHVCSSSTVYYDISKTATSGTTYIGTISFWM
jgi:hypothetical protein